MLRKCLIYCTFAATLSGNTATASCLTANTGAGCARVPLTTAAPRPLPPGPVEVGDILPRGKYSMVMNAGWYGLPPARDGWVYFRVEDDVYRVDFMTREVLERATSEAGQNWP